MTCFKRLVLLHISDDIPAKLDPHQYAFRPKDAISTALYSVFTELENKNSYIRMLDVDFRSAFNTIPANKLIGKLNTLLSTILDNFTNRTQRV